MLVRKMPYLDKVAVKKGLSGISRFNYDLAIVISKYDSFQKWKSEMAEQVENTFSKQDRITYKKSYTSNQDNNTSDSIDEVDLASIVDDLLD